MDLILNTAPSIHELDPNWYDFEVKRAFYEITKESQRPYLLHMYRKMNPQEVSLNTPLYRQNTRCLETFFFALMPLTVNTSYKGIAATIRYIIFAIENGHRHSNILLVENSYEYARRFIPTDPNEYLTVDQFETLVSSCVNPQDKVVFQMLFEGLLGEKLYELRNLKLSDIQKDDSSSTYTATLHQTDGNTRALSISKDLYLMCVQASLQTKYKLNNGGPLSPGLNGRRGDSQILNDSPFILKRSRIGRHANNKLDPIGYHGLYARIKRIMAYEELEGADPDYFKPQALYFAGAVYAAYQLIAASYPGPGSFNSLNRFDKHKYYDNIDLVPIRKAVCQQYSYLSFNRSRHILSEDNLKKYYS